MGLFSGLGGAIIGGASSLFGGLLGSESNEDAINAANNRADMDRAMQREFAQHGIRWRVKDAKAAGIHPVFALSGGGAAYAPSAVTVNADNSIGDAMARAGQDLGRAVAAQESPEQRVARQLAEEEMASRTSRNNAEADMFRSVTVKNYMGQTGPGMPSMVSDSNVFADGGRTALGTAANQVKLEPSKSTSYSGGDPSTAAAKDVAWKKFKLGNGREWWLPNADSASEAMESVSESLGMQLMVLRENMARNPYFVDENSHLLPYGQDIQAAKDWLSDTFSELGHRYSSWVDKKRYRPATTMRSGRDRGINWKTGRR